MDNRVFSFGWPVLAVLLGGLNTSCGIDIWNSIEVAYLGFMLHVVRSR